MPTHLLLALAVVPLVLAAAAAQSASPRPLRILPLGDSITQGGRNDRAEHTYRLPLARLLADAGVRYDFIGSLKTGLHADATWPDVGGKPFDADHEGHYGWTTAKVREKLPEWYESYPGPPDVVLVHLGTNDQGSTDFGKDIVSPLRDVVTFLRSKNPRVVVLLGHLNFNGGNAEKIRPLVEQLAKELDTPESPVRTVHHYKGWREDPAAPDTDTFDWAHPNPSGQSKMARAWFEAMKPFLAGAGAPATPKPSP